MNWKSISKLVGIIVLTAVVSILFFSPNLKPVYNKDITWMPLVKMINLGLDLEGGVHVVLQAEDTPESPVTDDAIKRVMAVINNRVNATGVAEPIIQQQGKDRIIVELAGIEDPDEAVNNMIKVAHLEFKTEDGRTVITGADLKDAVEATLPGTNEAQVNLTFTDAGAKKFAQITAANVNRHLGIYLDGQLLQNPRINEPIPNGQAQITGYSSLEEAHNIAILLRSGALPVKVDVIEKRSVGPMLGADSLAKSLKAAIVGIAAIFIFMAAYYRVPGLIANLALIIYTLIVLAVFAALNVTMTLPGIAGFLLSLGMAVDANIIIFERIKEELRNGKSLRAGIDAGFKRAFVTIVDSNVTTLLTAAVLFFLSTGPIKGFAVTLSVGILASMFTAVTLTRYMLQLTAGSKLATNTKLYGA
ncbi:protein translocase subunit SecD [Desulfolucanica intricata]|uniref:protein translocase subunit SecD n=1 Tax=Desulfolucanica intricata TaxID=1285191 RepID=UPI00082F8A7B|nr:protein translocase subunit SecD [Desulfolucanica intricata]